MTSLFAWIAGRRYRRVVPVLLVIALGMGACGHSDIFETPPNYASLQTRPLPPEVISYPRSRPPLPAAVCPDDLQTGASLRWLPSIDAQSDKQRESTTEILFVSRTEAYRLAPGLSRLERIIEAAKGPVRYDTVNLTYRTYGQSWFGSERLTAVDRSPDGTHVALAVCYASERPAEAALYDRSARHSYPTGRYGIRVWEERDLHEVLIWNRDSEQLRRLAVGRAPAWAADGQQLAFLAAYDYASGEIDDRLRLYVLAANGGHMRELARSVVRRPAWSPVAERLAYITGAGSPRPSNAPGDVLHTIRADGREARQLATDVVSPVAWAADGQRLAFARADGAEVALYTVAANGTDLQRVTTVEGWQSRTRGGRPDPRRARVSTVAWSPDGSMLVYACGKRVCVVRADGVRVGTSAVSLAGDSEAAWSPDGSRIAVITNLAAQGPRSLREVLYTMAPDGRDVRLLVQKNRRDGLHAVGARWRNAPQVDGCRSGVAVPNPTSNRGLVRDCETILRLYDRFAAQELYWNDAWPITEWRGVGVEGTPPRVRRLGPFSSDYQNLTGIIPREVSQLTALEELRLGGISLGGDIPPELGRLARLRVLDLRGTNVGGSIPPELGQLTSLEELLLDGTYLSGPIPPELGRLANLRHLDLSSTHLTGGIPPELGGLTQATFVRITGQRSDLDASLGGSIPPELGRLAKLEFLDLSHSGLTGGLPPELGRLAHLKSLDLSGNRLSGRVPPALGQLTSLTTLALSDNELTGSIPATLSQLPNLVRVFVDGNQLSGCLPPELAIPKRAELGLPDCEPAT